MSKKQRSWKDDVELAEHYLAIDSTSLHLFDQDDYPWEFVTKAEPGGSGRYNLTTSITVRAEHPSGLSFSWFVDLERPESSGPGHYQVDAAGMVGLMARLKPAIRASLRDYFTDCAAKVREQADERLAIAQRLYADAIVLEKLGQGESAP